jgi:hypothetical protein
MFKITKAHIELLRKGEKLPQPLVMTVGQAFDLLRKAGISSTSLSISNTLTPSRAREFISAVRNQNAFLGMTTRVDMRSLQQDVPAINLGVGNLVRFTNGTSNSAWVGTTNIGKRLTALQVDLFFQILLDTMVEFQDIPSLQTFLQTQYTIAFANDLVNLGFTGTDDDYTGSAYAELNKGWLHLAKNASGSHKVDISDVGGADYTGNQIQIMKAMLAQLPTKFITEDLRFVMGYAEFQDYQYELASLGGSVLNADLLQNSNASRFGGVPIQPVHFIASDSYLLTPMKNFVHGVAMDIRYAREERPVDGCINYRYTVYNDYEFSIDDAIVVAYDIP